MELKAEKDVLLIELTYKFLIEKGADQSLIKNQFVAWNSEHKSLNDIYFRLLESGQNRDSSVNVIGKSIGGLENLSSILYDFDPILTCVEYPFGSEERLLKDIISKLKPTGQVRSSNKSKWPQYIKTIISGAYFLSKYANYNNFIKFINEYNKDVFSRSAVALLISTEVFGLGFPLACDFLKELGYTEFSKADVHTKAILKELNLIGSYHSKNIDYFTFHAMNRIANNCNILPFDVDKLLWLIGGGNFYHDKEIIFKIGRKRDEFIQYAKNNGI